MNNPSMHDSSDHHRYSLWTWVVAILLALILLWMLLTGRGPSGACCVNAAETAPVAIPTEPIANKVFSFSAVGENFSSAGDGSNVAWLLQAEALGGILGSWDLNLQGDDKAVVLTGTVKSEAIKQQKAADLQAFLGPNVVIDNQLVVQADAPMAIDSPPAPIKLYFDSGKTTLAADATISLAAIVDWLKTHPESKAILSGYHDPKGNQDFNEALAKQRAEAVEDALAAAGIDVERVDKRKPQSVDGGTDLAEARRVEVSIE